MEVIVVDSSGALALQFLYEAGHTFSRMHAHEKMYMIVNAVDGMYKMMAVAADAGQIGVQFSGPIFADQRFAPCHGEDEMQVDLCVGVSHTFVFFVAYQWYVC